MPGLCNTGVPKKIVQEDTMKGAEPPNPYWDWCRCTRGGAPAVAINERFPDPAPAPPCPRGVLKRGALINIQNAGDFPAF